MIVLYILITCILSLVLIIFVIGVYDGLHGINRLKQNTVDTALIDNITYLEELKKQYISLSFTIENEYKSGKIKKSSYQNQCPKQHAICGLDRAPKASF